MLTDDSICNVSTLPASQETRARAVNGLSEISQFSDSPLKNLIRHGAGVWTL